MPRATTAASALLLAAFLAVAAVAPMRAVSDAGIGSLPAAATATTGYLEGIDVSHWQGNINWPQVAAAGKSFAIIKVTEGEKFLDSAYAKNIAGARAAGIRATAYHYAQPGLPKEEANIQADWYVDNARLRAGDLVPALDLEVRNSLSVSDLQAWVLTWLQRVEARLGVRPMIYVSPNFWQNFMGDTRMFSDLGYSVLWIAHWGVSNPSVPGANWGGRNWTFWQYTSDGSVPGISGRVDLDRYNGTDLSPVLYGPGKPTGVTGVPGDRQVTVSWDAPAASSGGSITAYTATAAPGGASCSTSGGTSCAIGGLANGTPYTFTVTATNVSGTGLPSGPSADMTPRTVPDPPSGAAAQPGNASAQVTWTPPAWNGGAPVTGYAVTASPGGQTCTAAGTSCVVNGLANGTAYKFTVAAINAAGTGGASGASNSVTPRTVPDAPKGVIATSGDGHGLVAWSEPGWHGGAPIAGYTVTALPGGQTCATGGLLSCEVNGLINGTPYTFTVTASNVAGASSPSAPSNEVTPWPPLPATYTPLPPARLLDTRTGNALAGPFPARAVRTFQVAGRGGVPDDATAVTGNITVTAPTAGGWLTIGPSAAGVGGFSTLNFPARDDRANGVTVALGPGGTLSAVFDGAPSTASTHAVFDVTGYFVPGTSGATFKTVVHNRLLDSRAGLGLSGPFEPGAPRTLQVTGRHASDGALNVPVTAIAVTGNLTVTGHTSSGWLTVTPTSQSNPSRSSLNVPANDPRANGLTVALGAGGTISIVLNGAPPTARADVIFDLTGYYVPGTSGAQYVPLLPTRLLDSRVANGLSGPFRTGDSRSFAVADRAVGDASRNVPDEAVAVSGNLTVTQQSRAGWLTVTPSPDDNPGTSTLNFPAGDTRANGLTVGLDDGRLSVVLNGGAASDAAHAIFDVSGYFVPAS